MWMEYVKGRLTVAHASFTFYMVSRMDIPWQVAAGGILRHSTTPHIENDVQQSLNKSVREPY